MTEITCSASPTTCSTPAPTGSGLPATCYLQDLYTEPSARGQGIGRALIEAVCDAARGVGIGRVYWHTHESNTPGRLLYDKVASHRGFIVYSHDA